MDDRAVPNNFYVELIHKKPPNFRLFSRIIGFLVMTGVLFQFVNLKEISVQQLLCGVYSSKTTIFWGFPVVTGVFFNL